MNEDTFERIDKYVSGEMNEEEKMLFQAEMAANEELFSTVNMYRAIEKDMSEDEKFNEVELSLKKTLEEYKARYFTNEREGLFAGGDENVETLNKTGKHVVKSPTNIQQGHHLKVRKINLGIKLAVAASFVGIIAFSVTWYLEKSSDSPVVGVINAVKDSLKIAENKDTTLLNKTPAENIIAKKEDNADNILKNRATLYAAYFKPDVVPEVTEGALENAFTYYENKQYAQTITAINNAELTEVTRSETNDLKLLAFYAYYYKGLSYMANKNIEKAIPELDSAKAYSRSKLWEIKCKWYLALAYLKSGNLTKTEKLLKEVAYNKEALPYKNQAQKLLKRLAQPK